MSRYHQVALRTRDAPISVPEALDCQTRSCADCPFRKAGHLCGTLFEGEEQPAAENLQTGPSWLSRSHEVARRRRTIYRNDDTSNSVAIICEGWACVYIPLPDGERQILTFLLPGDITSAAAVFQDHSGVSVEAVTDLRYCMIDKTELKLLLANNQKVFEEFSRIWAGRKGEVERLATDLGHKSAEQRIARLIMGLMERHEMRNLVEAGRFAFPLRQQHIADATGLTVVHVNRVIGIMRKLGLIEIEGRTLTVRDLSELRRFAN